MDEQLRRRSVGAPAARSLLLTMLGEFVLPRGEGVWQETLVAALASVGYTHPAARQALVRSTRDGWLIAERHGRRARMSLSDATAELLRTGAERIYSFARPWQWDGRWLVVVLRVPEERRAVRHQLRSRLAWAGLGSLRGGVWLTPHVEREAELAAAISDEPAAEAQSFVAALGSIGDPAAGRRRPGTSTRVRSQYDAFIEDFRASGRRLRRRASASRHCSCTPGASSRSWIRICPPGAAGRLAARSRAHDAVRRPPRALAARRRASTSRRARASRIPDDRPGRMIERLELLDIPGTNPAAPPLVLLHEGLGSVKLWRGFPDQLAGGTGARTIAFSRFGHGQSDTAQAPHTRVHARGGARGAPAVSESSRSKGPSSSATATAARSR